MPTVQQKAMGYEGVLYIGTVGATAANQVPNATDVEYTNDLEMGEVTKRGDGTTVPKKAERPSTISGEVTFKMVNAENDTDLSTLLLAARTPAPLAIKAFDKATGRGFDGDMNIKVKLGMPLKGEQTYEFTCTVNDDYRDPDFDAS